MSNDLYFKNGGGGGGGGGVDSAYQSCIINLCQWFC